LRRTDEKGFYALEDSHDLHDVCAAIVVQACELAYPKHTLRRRQSWTFSVSSSGAVCACWLEQDSFAFKRTICIFFLPPNGLRYPRWGRRRNTVRLGKC
jgi:hypothetical protein